LIEFNEFCHIERAFVSDKFLCSSIYDLISTNPIINREEIKLFETLLRGEERFSNIKSRDNDIFNNNYISYIKFIVNSFNETKIVSLMLV